MTRLDVTVLGGFQARLDSGRVLRLRSRQTQALLAYLALPPGRTHPRDTLAALLWGHLSQDEARHRLRQALFTLRRSLAPSQRCCLSVEGDALVLDPTGIEVDALVFEGLVAEGSPDSLERAATLYRGDLLQGLPAQGPHPSSFEEWLSAERERLRELALEALARLIAHQRAAGLPERALATALRLLSLDPLQEAAHRTVMRLYAQVGRRTAALHQYQVCVSLLRRDLHVEPEEETRQLYRDILRRRPVVACAQTESGPGGSLQPMGSAPSDGVVLVGREAETACLRVWLNRVANGSTQVALLVGEAGAGKSRLVAALVEAAAASTRGQASPILVLVGRCHEGEQILALGPWIDALRAGLLPANRDALEALEPVWRKELVRLLPELMDVGVPGPSDPPDTPRLFEGVRRLLACLAGQSPVVLILEDLHWADEMSLRLLQFLARRPTGRPLFLVGTLREEELPDLPILRQTVESLESQSHVARLHVAPLSRLATIELVRALSRATGEPAALDALGHEVWRASEGNPFVAIETMRAFQQGVGSIGPPRGRTLGEPPGLAVAERVRQMTARRLDRLSEGARELAAIAAVIGRSFEFRLLLHAAMRDETATAAGVEELVRRQVLHEAETGLEFVHERVRSVAYADLLVSRRRILHRQVAEALEHLHARDLDPHLLALGLHYREAEAWEKAAAYFARAGGRALARSATAEGVSCLEHAVEAINRLPESDATLRQGIDLRITLRYPLSNLGQVARLGSLLEEAERMAVELGDLHRQALVASGRCHHLYTIGHNTRANEAGERAIRLARDLRDVRLEGEAAFYLGLPLMALGRYREASDAIRRVVDHLETPGARPDRWPSGPTLVYSFLARCLAELGEFSEALAFGARGLARAERSEHPFEIVTACLGLGSAYLRRGDFANAIAHLSRGLSIIEAHHIDVWLPSTSACLGMARASCGDTVGGVALLDRALQHLRFMNVSAGRARIMAYRGEAHLLAGQVDLAHQWADAAFHHARDHRELGHEAVALRLLGEVSARRGPGGRARAEALYREALARADDLGMQPLAALCHLDLGRSLRERNQFEGARCHVTRAVETFKRLEMEFWLGSAQTGLSQLPEPVG